ncbi:MAG: hypothetical protein JSU09_03650 [Bacteroidetes bacterium]|jgi:hypothetical protein|nr:hypothetical protein [Bacteroidota bacterium]
MKKMSSNTGVRASDKKNPDYFEYARQNPDKGKVISHGEAIGKILHLKSEKLKKAS